MKISGFLRLFFLPSLLCSDLLLTLRPLLPVTSFCSFLCVLPVPAVFLSAPPFSCEQISLCLLLSPCLLSLSVSPPPGSLPSCWIRELLLCRWLFPPQFFLSTFPPPACFLGYISSFLSPLPVLSPPALFFPLGHFMFLSSPSVQLRGFQDPNQCYCVCFPC